MNIHKSIVMRIGLSWKVSVQWQGSAAMKQENSVFTSKVTSDGEATDLLEGLPSQSSQFVITSSEEANWISICLFVDLRAGLNFIEFLSRNYSLANLFAQQN